MLSNVLQSVPWLIDFIVDSGWAQEIVRSTELRLHVPARIYGQNGLKIKKYLKNDVADLFRSTKSVPKYLKIELI